jgi:hypothetical protein
MTRRVPSASENLANKMKYLKLVWGKVRKPLFLIIWTAGVIGWMYFYQEFTALEKQANWTINEVQKLQEQRIEIKSSGDAVNKETSYSAESHEQPEGREADKIVSPPPSGEIEKIIYEKFGEENYKVARAVAFGESRLNPNATNTNTNGTTDCGIFQINSIHGLQDCTDPDKNIEYAYKLFQRRGWEPWVVYKTGKYLVYLND